MVFWCAVSEFARLRAEKRWHFLQCPCTAPLPAHSARPAARSSPARGGSSLALERRTLPGRPDPPHDRRMPPKAPVQITDSEFRHGRKRLQFRLDSAKLHRHLDVTVGLQPTRARGYLRKQGCSRPTMCGVHLGMLPLLNAAQRRQGFGWMRTVVRAVPSNRKVLLQSECSLHSPG